MHIDEIIIDGFKSYASRTVIGKWDPKFNAITGLNGSGKSNILDSICFVLGITNLSHVRAAQLQDLVYKKGQAGINKASVTIIFNNTNKAKSPPGFEQESTISVSRQIIIGGKNKFLINGKNTTQHDVANMFHSVQLNINNPNFLIMQGKITQVLNMKPAQILGMVEEAAGTRLYEDRKDKALKAIEKKDSKLAHNEFLIATEITPKLDDLREKKRILLEFQKTSSELENLKSLLIAYDFMNSEAQISDAKEKSAFIKDRVDHLLQKNALLEDQIREFQERINEVMSERSQFGGAFFEFEKQIKELANETARMKTQLTHKLNARKDEMESKEQLFKNLKEAETLLQCHNASYAKFEAECSVTIEENQKTNDMVQSTINLVQTLTTGLSASEGQDNGYIDKLNSTKQEVTAVGSLLQQIKIKISHLQNELKIEEPKAKKAGKENQTLMNELDSTTKVLELIEQEISNCKFDANEEVQLVEKLSRLKLELESIEKQIENSERSLRGFEFHYTDPIPNFNRKKVKGLVANLISISKEHLDKADALEVCAGGKLYQVVVEDETTASQLIQKGNLRRRVTIIPLNKISATPIKPEKLAAAQKLAPNEVFLALSLIGSEPELEKAMSHVFGTSLVCKSHATAKKITFDKSVMLRSVTLDGDMYDPSGQLTGGAKSQSAGSLIKLQELNSLRNSKSQKLKEVKAVQSKLDELLENKNLLASLQQKQNLKKHELSLLQHRMENNPHCKVILNVEQMLKEHALLKQDLIDQTAKLKQLNQQVAEIEREMNEFSSNRDSKLKELRKKIADGKQLLANLEPTVAKMKESQLLAKEEISRAEMDIKTIEEKLAENENTLKVIETEEGDLKNTLKSLNSQHDHLMAKYNEEKKSLSSFDKEITSLEIDSKRKTKEMEESNIEVQQLQIELATYVQNGKQLKDRFKRLVSENPWVEDQRQLFGIAGGKYDFSGINIEESKKRVQYLQSQYEKNSKTVDRSALEKYDRVEKKESLLKQRLQTVKKDKTQIHNTLEYLDKKKLAKLNDTFEKVNKDFGLIFGELLPGNTCKLVQIEGDEISKGLEVKVCLGGVWKSSLTELSGGQRSLIALSLILALLQFNPAPMYILDEIDAALDLSHTQNIGKLLKSRFKTSQFIIVSLKDGMFNNANVLFRTRFCDGISMIERQTGK